MLFLVSGASGMGKSSVRELLAPTLGERFEAVELRHLGAVDNITLARRQELAEVAARRAIELARDGRHLLLSGDPAAPAEIIAAPSAVDIGGLAVCILDADATTQTGRLSRRGDPAEYLPLHVGFAQWMREHAVDPQARLSVVREHGAGMMRWDRLETIVANDPRWKVRVIDTSGRDQQEVAAELRRWIEMALADDGLVMHPENW